MPQSLTRLPKETRFEIGGCWITIRNHKIVSEYGLFDAIMRIAVKQKPGRNLMNKLEEHGISFEIAIEQCVLELEKDPNILTSIIYWECSAWDTYEQLVSFSKSAAGRTLTGQFVDQIRNCDNWDELHEKLHMSSEFQQDTVKRINKKIREQTIIKEEMRPQCLKT